MAFSLENLKALVKVAIENSASDVHIRTLEGPSLRIRGDLVPVKSNKVISAEDIKDICRQIFPSKEVFDKYDSIQDLDGVYEIDDVCRLRYNFFRYSQRVGLVMRIVSMDVPTIDDLNLSPVLKHISKQKRGLVLVTGATGAGKSTTLAAMINFINNNLTRHVVTIEDPIEYLHSPLKSRISQREVITDTKDYVSGLRSALRQDPDIILLGELRDAEAVAIALKAAETGHLVMATVHTTDAISTINRVLSMFPGDEQEEVRKRMAENLYSTISQRMLKGKTKSGICIAQEIMVTNPGVKECIRGEEPMERLYQNIEKGQSNQSGIKSQSFDQHIYQLFQKGVITQKEAESSVKSASNFLQKLLVE